MCSLCVCVCVCVCSEGAQPVEPPEAPGPSRGSGAAAAEPPRPRGAPLLPESPQRRPQPAAAGPQHPAGPGPVHTHTHRYTHSHTPTHRYRQYVVGAVVPSVCVVPAGLRCRGRPSRWRWRESCWRVCLCSTRTDQSKSAWRWSVEARQASRVREQRILLSRYINTQAHTECCNGTKNTPSQVLCVLVVCVCVCVCSVSACRSRRRCRSRSRLCGATSRSCRRRP